MSTKDEQQHIIDTLKAEGRQNEIHEALRGIKKPKFKKELAWLEGQGFKDYMNDMQIAQLYAAWNRKAMISEIVNRMGWEVTDHFTTIHNYIDMENMILRKGAISAQKDERVIIPINMKDGSIIAFGKGNPDWNFSGPHGAGRVMSRSVAKKVIKVDEFKREMKGVWTSSVNENTIDEAPGVYKPIDEILINILDSVEIAEVIKPIYNFKAN
jgi:RNA-splicing ligase RtcB